MIRIATLLGLLALAGCATTPSEVTKIAEPDSVKPRLEAMFSGSLAHLKAGEYVQAIEGFRALIAADPGLRSPRFNLALAQYQNAQYAAARVSLEALLAVDPRHVEGNNLKALLLQQAGDIRQAQQLLDNLISMSDFPAAHYNLGVLCDVYLGDLSCARYHYGEYQRLSLEHDQRVTAWMADLDLRDKENPAHVN